jgi:hypothetical protein
VFLTPPSLTISLMHLMLMWSRTSPKFEFWEIVVHRRPVSERFVQPSSSRHTCGICHCLTWIQKDVGASLLSSTKSSTESKGWIVVDRRFSCSVWSRLPSDRQAIVEYVQRYQPNLVDLYYGRLKAEVFAIADGKVNREPFTSSRGRVVMCVPSSP